MSSGESIQARALAKWLRFAGRLTRRFLDKQLRAGQSALFDGRTKFKAAFKTVEFERSVAKRVGHVVDSFGPTLLVVGRALHHREASQRLQFPPAPFTHVGYCMRDYQVRVSFDKPVYALN